MKDNIVLIGMPGCGKSTIGVLLAKNVAYGFLDADLVIQEQSGRKLQDMIDDMGPDAYVQFEEAVNSTLALSHTVIATGGSAVYGARAMEHLREIGTVVYLRVPLEELRRRIKNFSTRGIVMREDQTFEDLYEERSALYEKYADLTVDAFGKDLWSIVEDITSKLEG